MNTDEKIEAAILNDKWEGCLLKCQECGLPKEPKFILSHGWTRLQCRNKKCDNHVTYHRKFPEAFSVIGWNRMNHRIRESKNAKRK